MKFLRAVASISSNTLASRILGFIRDRIIYSVLGAGEVSDALSVSTKAPALFRRLFAEGAFNAAFVPTFSGMYYDQGAEEARKFASNIFMIMVLFLFLFVGITELFMPSFISYIAPGFVDKAESFTYAVDFTRITFPFIFFISLTALLGGVLNSIHIFGPPAATQVISNIVLIVVFYGLHSFFEVKGYAAAIGSVVSGAAQFFWLYWICTRHKMSLTFRWPKITPGIRKFWRLFFPGMLGAGIVQLNLFINMAIGSMLPKGQLTLLSIADRVNQLPLSLVGVALGTVMLPILYKELKDGNDKAIDTQNRAIEFALLLTLPAMVALGIYSDSIVALLFKANNFTFENVLETAPALVAFASGLPAYVLIKVSSSNFFARQDTVTPMKVAAISFFINAILSWLSVKYYNEEKVAHVGIALALSLSSWFNLILLQFIAWRRKTFSIDKTLVIKTFKIIIATAFMGGVIYYLEPSLQHSFIHGPLYMRVVALVELFIAAGVSFSLPAYFLGILSMKDIKVDLIRKGK